MKDVVSVSHSFVSLHNYLKIPPLCYPPNPKTIPRLLDYSPASIKEGLGTNHVMLLCLSPFQKDGASLLPPFVHTAKGSVSHSGQLQSDEKR